MSRNAILGMENAGFHYGAEPVFSGVSFLLDGGRTAWSARRVPDAFFAAQT